MTEEDTIYMMSNQRRYLAHKHGDTSHTIWLPLSSRLGIYQDQPEMSSNAYSEIYVCPACGLVSQYRSLFVQRHPVQTADQDPITGLYAAVLTFRCGVDNCGSPVLIRKPTTDTRATNTLVEEASSWTLVSIRCPEGHPVTRIPPDAVARTDQQLGLI